MNLHANFNYPCQYRLGQGRASELSSLCFERGIRRPLIVTDAGVSTLAWFAPLITALQDDGLECRVFSDLRPNPLGRDVDAGVLSYKEGQCDGVVLLGGGSAMDVGKCVALMVGNRGSVFDYEDVGDNWTRIDPEQIPPMIALPTTAGTGSEVGRASVIIDDKSEKKIIFHPKMQPADVIADPELTRGLPAPLTAYTGVDAFVHCFEAWCASGYHPMADGIALEGMRLIAEFLPRAVKDGDDIEARTHMILASSMGATAFQKGLGVVHAISHALGGKLNVHHGLANAILLPYCMVFNRPAIEARCEILARHLGLEPTFESLLAWCLAMRESLGIPHSLKEVQGMSTQKAAELAPIALKDAALAGNPRSATEAELCQIMVDAFEGRIS